MPIKLTHDDNGSTVAISADALMAMRSHLRIVHHIPGRLRVRVSADARVEMASVPSYVLAGALKTRADSSEAALKNMS